MSGKDLHVISLRATCILELVGSVLGHTGFNLKVFDSPGERFVFIMARYGNVYYYLNIFRVFLRCAALKHEPPNQLQ